MAPATVSTNLSADDTARHLPFEFNESVQSLVDASDNLKALPSKYNLGDTNDTGASSCESLPVIDYSALTSSDPHQRSKAVAELAEACTDWGFFVLVNHGVPEELIESLFATVREFFRLSDDEKKKYEAKSTSSPIACGNFNLKSTSNETFTLWRDFLKLYVHPDFYCPTKPQPLREILVEYTERTRKMARELVGAVAESMELDRKYVEEALELDSSFQKFGGNFYPPCPQPEQTLGLPAHNDPGLFTILLIHNGLAGLQIERQSHWFEVNPPPNSMIVNVGDHLEIFSNGRCKSSRHRAVVNKERERLSIAVGNGPGKDVVVGPAVPLVEKDGGALYRSMKYQEYVESQLSRTFDGISILDEQRIST
ncbi:2-oxoglutarate-dependent dioxygenase 19-like [Salvia divinorum]|uniref:2-oxoglutarate-dependent dioxygenase 19-like n=1 Tax=Salvia divinorum TaxID=28513 RepID=A0ABD1I832_SALDI